MKKREFLKTLAILPLAPTAMKLNELSRLTASFSSTPRMPVVFLGHGSPMNAIETNPFSATWQKMGQQLPRPNAILCVSAHWETKGTFVTAMPNPRTVHDFGGFPQALFDVNYPAPGSPELAAETKQLVTSAEVGLDHGWGLDHGTWSVVKNLYPKADIPIIQMSLDRTATAKHHYALAGQLAPLREKGVLIIGSGNMVHNLGLVAWDRMHVPNLAFDWAKEASHSMKSFILNNDHGPLIDFRSQGKAYDLAIPTPEHYLPLLYTLGLQAKNEHVSLFNDEAVAGSLTMTSLTIG